AMGSKYDRYWQARLGDLSRLVADAAAGKVASLVADDIANQGDRRSWHGNARIRGRVVLTSHMAHFDSLARITTGAGVFDEWPRTEFSLSMNDVRTLTIRTAERQGPKHKATHAHAQHEGRRSPRRVVRDGACARVRGIAHASRVA